MQEQNKSDKRTISEEVVVDYSFDPVDVELFNTMETDKLILIIKNYKKDLNNLIRPVNNNLLYYIKTGNDEMAKKFSKVNFIISICKQTDNSKLISTLSDTKTIDQRAFEVFET